MALLRLLLGQRIFDKFIVFLSPGKYFQSVVVVFGFQIAEKRELGLDQFEVLLLPMCGLKVPDGRGVQLLVPLGEGVYYGGSWHDGSDEFFEGIFGITDRDQCI